MLTQMMFGVICLVTVTLGLALQLLASRLTHLGTPREIRGAYLTGGTNWYAATEIFVLEREMLVDAGSLATRTANTLLYSAVIASLAIDFPHLWLVSAIVFILSLVPLLLMVKRGLDYLVDKHKTQKMLFASIKGNDASANRYREETLDAVPDLLTPDDASPIGRYIGALRVLWRGKDRYNQSLEQRYSGIFSRK